MMSEEGTDNGQTEEELLPALSLESAADSIAVARACLVLRQSVCADLRGAIRHILEAQEGLEGSSSISDLRLDLLEAIRLIGSAEARLKDSSPRSTSEQPSTSDSHPDLAKGLEPGSKIGLAASPEGSPQPAMNPQAEPIHAPAATRRLEPSTAAGPASRLSGSSSQSISGPDVDTRLQGQTAPIAEESVNRRLFRRLAAKYPIQLQPPYDEFSNSDLTKLPISGITLNLSRGGMLIQIDQGVLRHGRYLVRFLGAGQNVRPEIIWGRVRRSRSADNGWEVGVEFDSPLELLRP